jgi:hypothetical protein
MLLGVKYKSLPQNISEQGLVSTVFEVLVIHSQPERDSWPVCYQRVMFSFKLCSRIRRRETPGRAASIRTDTVLTPVSTAAVHVGANCTFSIFYLFFYNCRQCILMHLMGFISYPYGLGPWHASTENWILKLRTVFRYVIEHLGQGICLLQCLCRQRTQKRKHRA